MKELTGNIWDHVGKVSIILVPTNLSFTREGKAIMGKGMAKQALDRYPGIDLVLGQKLASGVYKPCQLAQDGETQIWSFPTKPPGRRITQYDLDNRICSHLRVQLEPNDWAPSWMWKSDLSIISSAAREMQGLPEHITVLTGRPGCGAGELTWPVVKERLSQLWQQDKYMVINYGV